MDFGKVPKTALCQNPLSKGHFKMAIFWRDFLTKKGGSIFGVIFNGLYLMENGQKGHFWSFFLGPKDLKSWYPTAEPQKLGPTAEVSTFRPLAEKPPAYGRDFCLDRSAVTSFYSSQTRETALAGG